MLGGATLTIIVAEQLCVKREMSEGLSVLPTRPEDELVEEMEMGGLLPRIDQVYEYHEDLHIHNVY